MLAYRCVTLGLISKLSDDGDLMTPSDSSHSHVGFKLSLYKRDFRFHAKEGLHTDTSKTAIIYIILSLRLFSSHIK